MDASFKPSERYERNVPIIAPEEQATLKAKRVCVCGCGGLGGYVLELLARAGVGTLVAIDPDVFEPSNLNRQLLARESNLGQAKSLAAQQRIADVNSEVKLVAHVGAITDENASELLEGCSLAVDALDSRNVRLDLERWCAQAGIPLVHGAVSGWCAQVSVIAPGKRALESIYPSDSCDGLEEPPTVISVTPALAASIQAAECLKVLLGKGDALFGKLLVVDLLHNTQRVIAL